MAHSADTLMANFDNPADALSASFSNASISSSYAACSAAR
jgi:hypothetical protein